jgi:crotonobetainyl-CoA:carnitine CoA-transferase CaiB-like acyl-CoA transferase
LSPLYRPLPTKDGYITVGPNTDAQAFAFFDAIGQPELKTDPRFDSAATRTANAEAYFQVRTAALARKTTGEWLTICAEIDVPAARYNTIEDLLVDPHLQDVGFYTYEDHPSEGQIRRTRSANIFSGGHSEDPRHAPLLGENTADVLADAGYSQVEIAAMLDSGAAKAG